MPMRPDEAAAGSLGLIANSLNAPNSSVRDIDMTLLANVLDNPAVKSLFEIQDAVETFSAQPVSCDNLDLVREIIIDIDRQQNKSLESRELSAILKSPYLKSLIEAHDDVGSKNYELGGGGVAEPPPAMNASGFLLGVNGYVPDEQALTRMIGIHKSEEEPLGLLVRQEPGGLVVARILEGSPIAKQGMACDLPGITVKLDDSGVVVVSRVMEGSNVHRQGLLHIGDIIKEVNGQEVTDPNQLTNMLKKVNGTVTFKVLPSIDEQVGQQQMYLKALFDYDPSKDKLIPSREAGLNFKHGDILQVVSMSDPHWWQARKVDSNALSGLIPSRMLEERRKAFVKPELDLTRQSLFCGLVKRKKKKIQYTVTKHADFDRGKIVTYEEVHRMPPFTRKLLVLIGARGTGRRTLKHMLVTRFPKRFASPIPYTSRQAGEEEVNGEQYNFITVDQMEQDIINNKFIEYGQHDGNWYGTQLDSIREIINSGRMCVIDLNPQALKQITTPEFQPYVVFIAAPSVDVMRGMSQLAYQHYVVSAVKTEKELRDTVDSSKEIERYYKHYFDMTIVNDNMEDSLNKLLRTIETFNTEPQWVPISWVL